MGFSEDFGGQSRDREGDTKDFKGQRPIEQRVSRDQPEVMESTQGQRGQVEVSSYPETRTIHLGPFWEEQSRDGDPQGSGCPVGVGRLCGWARGPPGKHGGLRTVMCWADGTVQSGRVFWGDRGELGRVAAGAMRQ